MMTGHHTYYAVQYSPYTVAAWTFGNQEIRFDCVELAASSRVRV